MHFSGLGKIPLNIKSKINVQIPTNLDTDLFVFERMNLTHKNGVVTISNFFLAKFWISNLCTNYNV
jgi:hypothetical protein